MVNLNKSIVYCRFTAVSHLLNKSLTGQCIFWCSDLSYLAGKAMLNLIHKTTGTLLLKLLLNISVNLPEKHSKKTISQIVPFKQSYLVFPLTLDIDWSICFVTCLLDWYLAVKAVYLNENLIWNCYQSQLFSGFLKNRHNCNFEIVIENTGGRNLVGLLWVFLKISKHPNFAIYETIKVIILNK